VVRRANIFKPEFDHSSERDGYRWQAARIGRSIGGKQIGASLYELPDGERSYPFHFHHAIEEWLVVVSGAPVLREAGGTRTLRAGDVVCFPVGSEGAHQVLGPGTVLIVSASASLEVSEYPDSGKVGVSHPRKVFRVEDAVDYWEGE
jgi:uncharacterized cupin superfamily protein